jgi:hypothetical protein
MGSTMPQPLIRGSGPEPRPGRIESKCGRFLIHIGTVLITALEPSRAAEPDVLIRRVATMTTYRSSILLVGLLIAGWSPTTPSAACGDDGAARKSPDQQFEVLLAAAQKNPTKADWKALRHAFAETSRYEPYSTTWRNELAKVGKILCERAVGDM